MDKLNESILKFINAQSSDGEFKIIELDEILANVPHKLQLDKKTLVAMIEEFKVQELISCKYIDATSCCVASTAKGKLVSENKSVEQKTVSPKKKFVIFNAIASAIGGFVGAVLGALVILPFVL